MTERLFSKGMKGKVRNQPVSLKGDEITYDGKF